MKEGRGMGGRCVGRLTALLFRVVPAQPRFTGHP